MFLISFAILVFITRKFLKDHQKVRKVKNFNLDMINSYVTLLIIILLRE